MGRDGTERASTEASAMQRHGEFYHLVGRYRLAAVFRMRQSGVGKIVGRVEFLGCHWWVRRINHNILTINGLEDALGMHLVGFFLDMSEVFGLKLFVLQALLMAVENDVGIGYSTGDILFLTQISCLRNIPQLAYLLPFGQSLANSYRILLAHTVENHVGTAVAEYALPDPVLPIVIMCQSPHRSFDTAQYYWDIGKELFQDLGVDNRGIIRPHVVARVWAVRIVVSLSAVGSVAVNHRVHSPRRYGKAQPRLPQLLEVTEVAVPVGLRDYGHLESFRFQHTANHRGSESRVVDISVAAEEDDIELIPSA